jgi:PIN domain-containing protein
VKFFFDNNLPPKLAKSLHLLVEPDHEVVHLKDRFPANASDEEWITALATEQPWVIISGDLRIRKNPYVMKAWKSAGHTLFFLKPGWINLSLWTQTWKLVKCFPDIVATAERAPIGSEFFVATNGKIE